jgi:hypothetical protein
VWPHGRVEAVEVGLGAAEAEVEVEVGLGVCTARCAPFTFYPRMPGNSTTRPAEKRMLQGGCMRPALFQGAQVRECTGWTHTGGGNALAFKQPT